MIVGVKCVVIFVFGGNDVLIIVYNINYEILIGKEIVILGVLCIINCLVFMVKILNDKFGVVEGLMIIIYVYIGD